MSNLQCPQCQADIEQDFGVITCAKCGAILMVDLEGRMQLANPELSLSHEPPAPNADIEIEQQNSFLEEEESIPQEISPAEDFRTEILQYANQEGLTGPLTYTVYISEIDGGSLRKSLKDILQDPKFKFDALKLMDSIVDGRLEIKDLNPVKASVLVQKLRRTPFVISWRQHVFAGE